VDSKALNLTRYMTLEKMVNCYQWKLLEKFSTERTSPVLDTFLLDGKFASEFKKQAGGLAV